MNGCNGGANSGSGGGGGGGGDIFSSSSVPIPGMAGVGGNQSFTSSNSQNDNSASNQGIRETGIIEKLLVSILLSQIQLGSRTFEILTWHTESFF